MTKIRVNELEHARQGALAVAERSARENRPGYLTGRVVGVDEEDSRRVVVDFGGSPISVLSGPGKWVPGSLVAVDVDGQNRPTRVRGAVTDVPAEHVEVEGAEPVVSWAGSVLEPREITEEERARIEETALGLETARADLAEAEQVLAGEIEDVETRLTADGVITENLLATGAVSARTINVVPESGQGGTVLTGTKIGMVNSDGTGMMDLSVDSDNYLAFYRDEAVNFSVSADGALTAQDVSANENLYYRGAELTEFLDTMPRGVLTPFIGLAEDALLSTVQTRLMGGSFDTPGMEDGGVREIEFLLQVQGRALADQLEFQLRATVDGSEPTMTSPLWANIQQTSDGGAFSLFRMSRRIRISPGLIVRFMWFVRSLKTSTNMILYPQASVTYCQAADLGASPGEPALVTPEAPNVPDNQTTAPRYYSTAWNMSSFQNYRAGVRLAHTSGNIAGGHLGGEWRGIMLFPHTSIRSALSGAAIDKVEVYLQNAHTHVSSGSTVLIGSHNYASAPASSPAVDARVSRHFGRGQGRWVTLPTAVGTGFAGGTIKGLAVYGGSTANYATWTPSSTKIRISYKK